MIKEKISLRLTIPTLIAIISALVGVVGYCYSIDKRLSLVEQSIVHVEQDIIQQDKQLNRLEDKIDKIYEILVTEK